MQQKTGDAEAVQALAVAQNSGSSTEKIHRVWQDQVEGLENGRIRVGNWL